MTRPQDDPRFVHVDPNEMTAEEELGANADPPAGRPVSRHIARARRQLEAVGLSAALVLGAFAIAHEPTRTPSIAGTDGRAVLTSPQTINLGTKAQEEAEQQRLNQSAYLDRLLAAGRASANARPPARHCSA